VDHASHVGPAGTIHPLVIMPLVITGLVLLERHQSHDHDEFVRRLGLKG
jgi:hypothetical protein